MDQLTACRVLGLEPNSTLEEVKEAYAALSKQYHPEEYPEQFQEIHEAYITLTRRKRRGSVQNVYHDMEEQAPVMEEQAPAIEEQAPVVEEQTSGTEENNPKQEFDFNNIQLEQEARRSPTYSFEEAMEKAKQEEEAKSHELVLEAAAELKILVSPKYKSNLNAYKGFFCDKKYEAIIRRADFLGRLCDVLEDSKLKKTIYHYIIDFYRLRGRNPSELSEVGLRLYQILDQKAGMKKPVNPVVYGGIAVSMISCIRALRPIVRQSEVLTIITLLVIGGLLLFWAVRKLQEKRSALFVQAIIAIALALSQFVVMMFDLYGTLFGTVDDGNNIAAWIFLAAMAWLAIVIFVAIVKAIVGIIRKIVK